MKDANYNKTKFNNKVDFNQAEFKAEVEFKKNRFAKEVDFSLAKINFLIFQPPLNENFSLNLQYAEINKMNYEFLDSIQAKNVSNHQTFTLLKNFAQKKNDSITALKLYQKEMEKYYEEVKNDLFKQRKPRKLGDYIILFFEKKVSYFGTSIFRSFFWFLFFNAFFLLGYCFDKNSITLKIALELIIPLKADEYTWWHVFSLIINSILIYEVVKSLRKFSRKL